MNKKFYVTDSYIPFDSFRMIVDLSHMRIKINNRITSDGKSKPYIESLDLLKLADDQVKLSTFDIYKTRCTEILESKILGYLSTNPEESRPNGTYWKEAYGNTFTGDPNCRYYHLGDMDSLFSNALVHSHYLMEKKYSIITLFSKEDMTEYENDNEYPKEWTILIPMTPSEIQDYEYEISRAREEMIALFHDYHNDDDDYDCNSNDADSWMDNPEDYWNID